MHVIMAPSALASSTLSGRTLAALVPLFVLLGALIIYCPCSARCAPRA